MPISKVDRQYIQRNSTWQRNTFPWFFFTSLSQQSGNFTVRFNFILSMKNIKYRKYKKITCEISLSPNLAKVIKLSQLWLYWDAFLFVLSEWNVFWEGKKLVWKIVAAIERMSRASFRVFFKCFLQSYTSSIALCVSHNTENSELSNSFWQCVLIASTMKMRY